MRPVIVLWLGLLFASVASAQSPVDDAASLLSRYPAGAVPVDPACMSAIGTLGEAGSTAEVGLLRHIVRHERAEVRRAAMDALEDIRARQHELQRREFARTLPDRPDLEDHATGHQARGVGREESYCAAYADYVLGTRPLSRPAPQTGDAKVLLASGMPYRAAAALVALDGREARWLEARAHEDMGDPRGAVQRYAMLAARGDLEARAALDGFGIDPERLLVGLLSRPDHDRLGRNEAQVLGLLVGSGQETTVAVLAERTTSGVRSDRLTAADALVQMLDAQRRHQPLTELSGIEAARAVREAVASGLVSAAELGSQGR